MCAILKYEISNCELYLEQLVHIISWTSIIMDGGLEISVKNEWDENSFCYKNLFVCSIYLLFSANECQFIRSLCDIIDILKFSFLRVINGNPLSDP